MSFDITTSFVKQYGSNVQLLSQQKGSILQKNNAVRVETGVGEHWFFDQIGATSARRVTTRHADSPLISTPHSRRRVTPYDYDWGDLVDQLDKVKTLNDPTNEYAINAAHAMGRAKDDLLIEAFFADASTGQDGGTTTSYDTGNDVVHGSSGMSVAKLLSAKEVLDGGDVDPDIPRFILVSPTEITDLLNTTEVASSDYNTVKALAKGEISDFCGFHFLVSNRLEESSDGNERYCPVWAQDGMLLAVAQDYTARIEERSDKRFSTYVYFSMSIGATRMEEAKVARIKTWIG
jgi:hypothetical protein